jgi:serine protease inhibitor
MISRRLQKLLCFLFAGLLSISSSAQAEDATLSASCNAFGFKLLKELAPSHQNNFVVSPYSAYTILSLVRNGASGITEKEMASALSQEQISVASVNELIKDTSDVLQNNKKNVLEIANSVFVKKGLAVKQPFLDVASKSYDAKASTVEFGDSSTLKDINDWVSEKTHGKIPVLLAALAPQAVMVLINAVYFKGTWAECFKEEDTHPQEFYRENGKTDRVSMMHQAGRMTYFKGDDFQAVRLPYSEHNEEMVIVLPSRGESISTFITHFSEKDWQAINSQATAHQVNLSLPRFHIESTHDLNQPLQNLGMKSAFSRFAADFSNIANGKLYISQAIQKAYIETDEKGSEAAAATAVVMSQRAAVRAELPIVFVVDRPFLFGLQTASGTLLFLGVVTDPQAMKVASL